MKPFLDIRTVTQSAHLRGLLHAHFSFHQSIKAVILLLVGIGSQGAFLAGADPAFRPIGIILVVLSAFEWVRSLVSSASAQMAFRAAAKAEAEAAKAEMGRKV